MAALLFQLLRCRVLSVFGRAMAEDWLTTGVQRASPLRQNAKRRRRKGIERESERDRGNKRKIDREREHLT
jgi:hypothetical protein